MAPKIALLGDVMLGRLVARELASRNPEDLWAPELREELRSCDAVICNLECCISERGHPTDLIAGKRFFFRGPPTAVDSLTAIGVSAAGLANNHALDFGPEAVADTLTLLDAADIATVGAGPDPETARHGATIEAGDARVGIVAASDHPAEYAAGPGRWGIAWADLPREEPDWLSSEIARLDAACDLVLVWLHWGPNMVARPSGGQREMATRLMEAGADAIAGHSAHVFHGIGWGESGPLLYDLGDALDDYAVDSELRNDLGVIAIWTPAGNPELELVGIALDFCHTRLADGADAEWIAHRLDAACSDLGTRVERTAEQRFSIKRSV